MRPTPYADLQVEEDIRFERKNWKAERIAWVVLSLIVLAASTGLLGRGGISSAKAGSANEGMEIYYERFLRFHAPDKLTVTVHNQGQAETYRLVVAKEWLERVQLERIHPTPQSERQTTTGTEFEFKVAAGNSPLDFTFYLRPEESGTVKATFSDSNGNSLSISQFVYP